MIAWFARNHLAANLMIAIILVLGAHSVWKRTTLEVNPAFRFDEVQISVEYRGGTPADVERAVVMVAEALSFPTCSEAERSCLGGKSGLRRAEWWVTPTGCAGEQPE